MKGRSLLHSLRSIVHPRKANIRIVMLGLDGAGKTSLLRSLRGEPFEGTSTTIGYNVENVRINGSHFTIWDAGGSECIRPIWRYYFHDGIDAVIFVVDSSDGERLREARAELDEVLAAEGLAHAPILILASQQDRKGALEVGQISRGLGIRHIHPDRKIRLVLTSAETMAGFNGGFQWIEKNLS